MKNKGMWWAPLVLIGAMIGAWCPPAGAYPIFTVNSVGFVSLTVKPGWNLMNVGLFSQNDTTILSGQTALPVVEGMTVVKVNESGFVVNNYLAGRWNDPTMELVPGEAYFIRNPTSANLNQTTIGQIFHVPMRNALPAGYSMASSQLPIDGPISLAMFDAPAGTRVYQWDHPLAAFKTFTFDGVWSPSEPALGVAEGLCIYVPNAFDWIQVFYPFGFGFSPYNIDFALPPVTSLVGEVNTMTYNTNANLGRVFDADGLRPVHSAFKGQFYLAVDEAGTSFVPTGQAENFLIDNFAGFLRGKASKLPGTSDGKSCTIQLRVWEASYGATYETAVSNGGRHGTSPSFSIVAHAPVAANGPGAPPVIANTFPNFNVSVGSDLRPRFTDILRDGTRSRLRMILPPGESFRVFYADSITSPVWTAATEVGVINGQGVLIEVTGPAVAANQKRFYRLVKVP